MNTSDNIVSDLLEKENDLFSINEKFCAEFGLISSVFVTQKVNERYIQDTSNGLLDLDQRVYDLLDFMSAGIMNHLEKKSASMLLVNESFQFKFITYVPDSLPILDNERLESEDHRYVELRATTKKMNEQICLVVSIP